MAQQKLIKNKIIKGAVWLGGGLLAISVVGVAGAAIYQAVASSSEKSNFTAPGKIIFVGDTSLYVHCTGAQGKPTILLENGMGLVGENWHWVQKQLSQKYRVCSYDRAGTGFSPSVNGTIDAERSADQLAKLLEKLGNTGPVLLAGHSYGALIGRVFAKKYPNQIAGLVMVDSSHEDMGERFPPQAKKGFDKMLNGFGILKKLNRVAGARIMGVADKFAAGLSGDSYKRAYHLYATPQHMAGADREAKGWGNSGIAARKVAADGLGDLPITVLMVDNWPKFMMPSWTKMQSELAQLSTNARFETINGPDHFQVLGTQKYAQQVATEIDRLAQRVF